MRDAITLAELRDHRGRILKAPAGRRGFVWVIERQAMSDPEGTAAWLRTGISGLAEARSEAEAQIWAALLDLLPSAHGKAAVLKRLRGRIP
jgi:hypothetical protein